ncbi:hypothetical protein predicted by Glimmer/Critica [Sorangium cellulosum So ce56]|uniref:Uncharacterized protein n=1 Tax=Sorangium cellulosum (strain So ce56) TaxID=448385 RepID=A9FWV5_SORC5|nr:hypothetical protein predicted by Glimmer/Critica [Sorangium cellulosum So ce56]
MNASSFLVENLKALIAIRAAHVVRPLARISGLPWTRWSDIIAPMSKRWLCASGTVFLGGSLWAACGVCEDGVCREATCSDGVMNGDEAGLDCGGPCAACPL